MGHNKLGLLEEAAHQGLGIHRSLRFLNLNWTSVPMKTVGLVLTHTPNLKQLSLCGNNYTKIHPFQHEHLETLMLNENQLMTWTDVESLNGLRSLKSVLLQKNPIRTISNLHLTTVAQEGDSSSPSVLLRIQSLNLEETDINEWESIDELARLPLVRQLRIRNVPLFHNLTTTECRRLCIARLPGITHFNGSEISDDERLDAENYLVRVFANEEKRPPRFFELLED
eukprot:Colp12_sorted_trinity150504_noHs@28352